MKGIFLAIALLTVVVGCEPQEEEVDLSELKRMVQVDKEDGEAHPVR